MPAVFVHGVPDTHHLWAPLLAELERDDVVTLSLPGFGCPVPAGFRATKEAYADFVVDRVREIGAPVDLVGHDWGSLLVQYAGSANPDLVRTWAAACGVVDVEYEWHELAKLWQTPGVGEQVMAAMSGDGLAAGMRDAGHPDPEACAARIDETMLDCVLELYRSAVTVGAEWQPTVERNRRPALVLWGTDDPYTSVEFAERVAQRAGGEAVVLDGGHWAPIERAGETAAALERFWAAADEGVRA